VSEVVVLPRLTGGSSATGDGVAVDENLGRAHIAGRSTPRRPAWWAHYRRYRPTAQPVRLPDRADRRAHANQRYGCYRWPIGSFAVSNAASRERWP
jgi:hypothetical protein